MNTHTNTKTYAFICELQYYSREVIAQKFIDDNDNKNRMVSVNKYIESVGMIEVHLEIRLA